jgi:hypothetical protein
MIQNFDGEMSWCGDTERREELQFSRYSTDIIQELAESI